MEAINLCNDGASIKLKLELFLKQLSGNKSDNFQHLRERVAANDLEEDKYIRVGLQLLNYWMFPSHDLLAWQIIQTILIFIQTPSTF